jgi:hypothetical protein
VPHDTWRARKPFIQAEVATTGHGEVLDRGHACGHSSPRNPIADKLRGDYKGKESI